MLSSLVLPITPSPYHPSPSLLALDAEDRARLRQTRELFGIGGNAVEPGEEWDALRNQPRKLAQDLGAILDRELDQGDVLFGPPATEHAATGDPSAEHPVCIVQPSHYVAMVIDSKQLNGG